MGDVPPQDRFGAGFVNVLAAGAAASGELPVKLALGDLNRARNDQHELIVVSTGAAELVVSILEQHVERGQ